MRIRDYEVTACFEFKWQDMYIGLYVKPGHARLCLLPCLPLHVEWYRTVRIADFVNIEVDIAAGVPASSRPLMLWSKGQVDQVFGPSNEEYEAAAKFFKEEE